MQLIERSGRILCRVRTKGRYISQTFENRSRARAWGTKVEAAVDEGRWPVEALCNTNALRKKYGFSLAAAEPELNDDKPNSGWTIKRALDEYSRLIDHEKGLDEKLRRVRTWQAHDIGMRRLDDPDLESLLQTFVDERDEAGRASSTIRNDIFTLGALYTHATAPDIGGTGRHGWGLAVPKPTKNLILPPPAAHRDRRLHDAVADDEQDEEAKLLGQLAAGLDGRQMACLFILALETGMRLGEILDVKRSEIRRHQGTRIVHRQTSKNANPRRVTLSTRAQAAVDEMLMVNRPDDRLFTLKRSDVENRWQSARAKIPESGDLHWHDLRHEALSRLASKGLNLAELKEMSGHKSEKMLMRYINAKPSEIAAKLG